MRRVLAVTAVRGDPRSGLAKRPCRRWAALALTHPRGCVHRRRMAAGSFDPAYNTVARDDFEAMIEVDRYGKRTDRFDELIARTEEHYWNPDDADYVDYATP